MLSEGVILDVARNAFTTIIITAAPALLVSLIIGLVISIFQTVTSIQEQTLTFVPKLLALLVSLSVLGGSMLNSIHEFMIMIFNMIAEG